MLLSALGACSDQPRNQQKLAHWTDPITWSGRDVQPNVPYILVGGDGTNTVYAGLTYNGDILENATTAATVSNTDDVGTKWYGWSKSVTLPGTTRLWKVPSANVMEATVHTMPFAAALDASKRVPLTTFDFGSTTDTCISNNKSGGGLQIMNKCKSATSGFVKIQAPCGTKGQACCPVSDTWFNDPRSCNTGLRCDVTGPFGDCKVPEGGSCTTLADCVHTANACSAGICKNLRPLGGSCSTLADCQAPANSCTSGRCTAANGTSCTANNQCQSNICKAGVCSIDCTEGAGCQVAGKLGLCKDGRWSCTPQTRTCKQVASPAAELCDNKDNNCDGNTDENNPQSGGSCGTDTGECSVGKNQCRNGALVCEGGIRASAEICNDKKDNDCDGSTDENCAPACIQIGQACGSGTPCCLQNHTTRCVQGVCRSDPPGGANESCDWYGENCCPGTATSQGTCNSVDDNALWCNGSQCVYR